MIEEPNRIGLTNATANQLDELLDYLNPNENQEGTKLIKFDLYRLAVAIGIKNSILPPELIEKSNAAFRVSELDPDQLLFTVLETKKIIQDDCPIYCYIERLAEFGIQEFFKTYNETGELPLESYFQE